MTVWKIQLSSKVTDSKVESRICKTSKWDFEQFGRGDFILIHHILTMYENYNFLRILVRCIVMPWFHSRERLGSLRMWFDLARELKYPGNLNSGALSRTLAPELRYPGTFYSGAKKIKKKKQFRPCDFFFGPSQPASKANPPAEAVRPT